MYATTAEKGSKVPNSCAPTEPYLTRRNSPVIGGTMLTVMQHPVYTA